MIDNECEWALVDSCKQRKLKGQLLKRQPTKASDRINNDKAHGERKRDDCHGVSEISVDGTSFTSYPSEAQETFWLGVYQ